MQWLLFFDLDGTLWDHKDISVTSPPFRKISDLSLEDSQGVRINAFSGAVNFLKWSREHGAIISSLSWNIEEMARAGLETIGLTHLFDNLAIQNDPDKASMIARVVEKYEREGRSIPRNRMVYIDDRDIHIKEILARYPDLMFIQIWNTAKNYGEAIEQIVRHFPDLK